MVIKVGECFVKNQNTEKFVENRRDSRDFFEIEENKKYFGIISSTCTHLKNDMNSQTNQYFRQEQGKILLNFRIIILVTFKNSFSSWKTWNGLLSVWLWYDFDTYYFKYGASMHKFKNPFSRWLKSCKVLSVIRTR